MPLHTPRAGVYVTKVIKTDGSEKMMASPNFDHAEECWRALTDRAIEMVTQKRDPVTTQMYVVSLSDENAALRAVQAGQAELVKTLTIRPPTNLRNKVLINGPRAIDAKALSAAADTKDDHLDMFFEAINSDILALADYRARLDADPDVIADHIEDIFQLAYRLAGRGGAFGYELLTKVADRTCRFILDRTGLSAKYVKSLNVHIDMIQLIVAQKLAGDGGQAGASLMMNLNQLHKKAAADHQITLPDAPKKDQRKSA